MKSLRCDMPKYVENVYLCNMSKPLELSSTQNTPAETQMDTFTTNLLLDAQELCRLASIVQKWHVVIEDLTDEQSHMIFYRNIIRLTAIYHVPRERFTFVVKEDSMSNNFLVKKLRATGFTNFVMDCPENVASEPNISYGKSHDRLFCNIVVAGLQYHVKEDDPLWGRIYVGAPLRLETEQENMHDANAVAIFFEDRRIGYVPRNQNTSIAALLNSGWTQILYAQVGNLNPSASYPLRLSVDVFVARHEV